MKSINITFNLNKFNICSDMLRKIVTEVIASMMVLPNKFPIQLSDLVEPCELKASEPEVRK